MAYNLRSRKRTEMEVPTPAPPREDREVPVEVEDIDEVNVVDSESQKRALGNEYILAEVLAYLSVKDLKECRRVNKFWSKVATRMIAPKTRLVSLGQRSGLLKMETFMETMGPPENLPCRKFQLYSYLLLKATPEKHLVLPKFVDKFASIFIHLSLYSGSGRFFPWKKPKSRNEYSRLKSLELAIHGNARGSRLLEAPVKSNVDFMIQILENSPNLDTVSICLCLYSDIGNAESVRAMDHVPWNQISHLKLSGRLRDEYYEKILDLGATMQLKSFEMRDWNWAEEHGHVNALPRGETCFQKFLDRQCSSLETLEFQFRSLPEQKPDFQWPSFSKLKALKITVRNYRQNEYPLFAVSSFSKQFPVLSSLTVTASNLYTMDEFFRSGNLIPVETVKNLRLDSSTHFPGYMEGEPEVNSQRVIRHLAKMFPRVRKLGVPAHSTIMKAIDAEGAWQDMKDLTLFCGHLENVESALTGYTPVECDRISKLKPESWEFQEEERKMETRIYECLHNLETMEFNSERVVLYMSYPCRFTDVSCRLVLLKLKNLKCLNLCGLCRLGWNARVMMPVMEEMERKFEVLYG